MKDGKIITDLYLKPTDTYLYLDSLLCLPYHCKKSTPYGQALRLNRFCSNNAFFYQRCNELEYWLHERGYSESFDFSCFGLLLSLFTSSSFLLLLSLLLSLFNYFHYYILLSLQSSLLLFSVLSMLFILFYLILFLIVHITNTFVCVLRVTCMCPLVILLFSFVVFFPFSC